VVLVGLLVCAVPSLAATWVWSDGDFPEDDWDVVSWYPPLDSGESDATLAFTLGHAGNPGFLRTSAVALGDGPDDGAMIVQLNNQWTINPATSGPLVQIDGGLDFLKSTGGPSRIGLAVRQDGAIFVHVLNPQAADTVWTTYDQSMLTAADFTPIDPDETGQPDFSQNGSEMTFGFACGQMKPFDGGWINFYQNVDNVLLVMTTGPVSAVGPLTAGALQAPTATPNPFNPRVEISFEMPASGPGSLRVHDLSGRLVRVLASRHFERGTQTVTWGGRDEAGRALASGVYLVVLKTDQGTVSRRITLAK